MILLAGAAGTLGGAVVNALKNENLKFRCLDLKEDKLKEYEKNGIEIICGNLSDRDTIGKALQGVKTVISVVGLQKENEEVKYMDVDFKGNRNLMEASKRLGAEQFIYVSALGTSPDAKRKVHQAKWLMEEALRNSGLKYTIFRPSGFFSDFVFYFGKQCKEKNSFTLIGSGEMKVQPIHIDDLAKCIVKSIGNPKAFNKVFPIGGPDRMTLNELIEFYGEFFGKKIKIRHVPMGLMEFLATVTGGKIMSRDFLLRLKTDSICDSREVRETTGVEFTSLKDYIKKFDWSKI